ncbi:Retrovirus-related Pol polyprotein from transposon TNT 1-94 [Sesamum angolense]|uniref:Retrovirus-related Pol polyprotein from transposon TNT 1-94 n=1 Tax=Sesamum angolense TaxID=2727404 RepID=A0AAE1WQB7_9LAMI|nr:Retrovirus-related Pol polyprotein from transposon TNT 1-94 [Sesamum angolense]
MVEEMESLHKNQTWELVRLPEGKKTIGCKWVYRKKPSVLEKEGKSSRLGWAVLALVASWDLHLEQMDIKTAFLHGDLENRFTWSSQMGSLNLDMSIWFIGYKRCEYDCCDYVKSLDDDSSIFLLLAATKILGMEIHRDRGSRKLWLSQRGYVEKVLDTFGMSKAKQVSTPLANYFKHSIEQYPKTDREVEDMAKVPYTPLGGSQVDFQVSEGTVGHGIVFGSQQNDPLVVGYVDSDYAGDLDDRRSTTGYGFTLGGGPICWKSTIQSIVAFSTTEAEYMAVAEAAKEALWLSGLSKELGVEQGGV